MSVTILVVDDATFVRDLIKRTLRRLLTSVQVLEAPDGTRAQALMRRQPVDLILSDWEMPGLSGEELLRWVRQEPATAETPFVMITSRGDRDHVLQAINAGVSDYLTKPFSADELTRKLLKQFNRLGVKLTDHSPPGAASPHDSVSILTGAGEAAAPSPPAAGDFAGRVLLRFAGGSGECVVKDMTLQTLTGEIARDLGPPALFESAVVDLELPNGDALARINAYVHALQAVQANPDCDRVKIVLRFVDSDPSKLEALSKCLTRR